jgi:DNA-directed RNA polymerase subunit RPC12/RpoP
VSYRCPTCTTQYRPSGKGEVTGYVRCKVCGFLIDVASNRSSAPSAGAPAAPARRWPWPLFVAVFLVLLGLAWVVAVAQRSGAL